jgi:hypothetical protein
MSAPAGGYNTSGGEKHQELKVWVTISNLVPVSFTSQHVEIKMGMDINLL